MGLFEKIFKKEKQEQAIAGYFKTLSAYTPTFSSFEGGLYEMELTRAAIHSFATHVSKLRPELVGDLRADLKQSLQFKPNPFMDTSKFLYRLATIYSTVNNAFIIPIENKFEQTTGYFPALPQLTEVVDVGGVPYLRYTFGMGQKVSIELERVGLLNQYQYKDDFFGENNRALMPTLQLLHTQNQGIIEGVKNSATLRFLAKLGITLDAEDIKAERKRLLEENFSPDNNGGVLLIDQKYSEIKQIYSQPFVVNAAQMKIIQENVYSYFGINENILRNSFKEEEWGAYYEGKIEPFAVQLSLVMSNMTFTPEEIANGSQILFTANRLQYANNSSKLNIVTQLYDRGFITHNQGLEIFNMAPVEDGDKRYIRKEYSQVSKLDTN